MRVFYAAQRARSTHWRGPAIFLPTRLALQAASYVQRLQYGKPQRLSESQFP
jgi:hypothetical protein